MQEYKGNAIYNYILNRKYSYFFCVKNNWVLIYGNACCMPKLLVYVSKVPSLNIPIGNDEHSAFFEIFQAVEIFKSSFSLCSFYAQIFRTLLMAGRMCQMEKNAF